MLGASVDLGPFLPIEQALLAESVADDRQPAAFGHYSLTGGLAAAAAGKPSNDAATRPIARARPICSGRRCRCSSRIPIRTAAKPNAKALSSRVARTTRKSLREAVTPPLVLTQSAARSETTLANACLNASRAVWSEV